MSQLNDPRLINRIKRRYDLRSEGPQSLADQVVPVAIVDSLDDGQAVGSAVDRAVSSAIKRTAAAGKYAGVQLWNYTGSGVVAILDRILLCAATASDVKGGHSTTSLGTGVLNPFLDNRIAGNDVCLLRHEELASATAPDEFFTRLLANTPYVFEVGAILKENTGYTFVAQGVTVTLYATLYWRERPIRDLDEPS